MADSAAVVVSDEAQVQGRPRHELDPKSLHRLAKLGLSKTSIANFFDCSVTTLNRRLAEPAYAGAYLGGLADLDKAIMDTLYTVAITEKNVPALLKLAEWRCGVGAQNPISLEVETEGKTTFKLRWTPEMDGEFDAFLAAEKEHPTIDVTDTSTLVKPPEPDVEAEPDTKDA